MSGQVLSDFKVFSGFLFFFLLSPLFVNLCLTKDSSGLRSNRCGTVVSRTTWTTGGI